MKTIGMLAGMSWESSLEYYRLINEGIKDRLGGLHSAQILMYSFEFGELERYMMRGNWDRIRDIMVDRARKLEDGGADLMLIATNTVHLVAPDVQDALSIPLLHIADATGKAVAKAGYEKVALLGTRFTMEKDFYSKKLAERYGVQTLIPDELDRTLVHDVIFDELCRGEIKESSRKEYLRIMDELGARGAQAVVLGCTEIPLLVRPSDTELPLFDTTALHAAWAVEEALAE